MVDATTAAVAWMSSALVVGVAGALPHALSNRLSMAIPAQIFFFIMLKNSLVVDFDFIFIYDDRKIITVVKSKFANDLPAADPNNIQIISKRRIDLDLVFDRVLKNCNVIVWGAPLQ